MEIAAYLLAMVFALFAVFIVFVFISYDVKQAKRYKNADRSMGIVQEKLREEKVAAYGRNQYRKYGKYSIWFSDGKEVYTDEVLIGNRKLEVGDEIEVRYVKDEEGVHLVNDVSVRRLKEIVISFLIVLPFCVFLIYLKKNGML